MKKDRNRIIRLVTLFLLATNVSKAQDTIVYDVRNGYSINKQIYLNKGESGCVKVIGFNPLVDSVVFKKIERDVVYEGNNSIIDPLERYSKSIEGTDEVSKDITTQINAINTLADSFSRGVEAYYTVNKEDKSRLLRLKEKKQTVDSVQQVILGLKHQLEYRRKNLLKTVRNISDTSALNEKLLEAKSFVDRIVANFNAIRESGYVELMTTCDTFYQEEILFYGLLSELRLLRFEVSECVSASKEESIIKVVVYKRNSTTAYKETTFRFITKNRFKISNSIGVQAIVIDGVHTRTFDNVDSQIFDRKLSNIQPSFATYLHGTWRVRDAQIGLGFGVGIPIPLSSEDGLTPNFSIVYTTLFQTDSGRFGFNIGCGIREVNILAPGYAIGGKLSDASIDVPTITTWRPGLVVGISYVIDSKD